MNLMGNFIYNLGPIVIFDFLIMESIVMRGNSAKDCQSKKNPQPIASSGLRVLAQREGFEPSSGFSRYTISNRARYDLFDTAASAGRWGQPMLL